MQRVRVAIVGAGPLVEWGLLPVLTGPDAAAPQDAGAWWSRRPATTGEIRYQPPALPEVAALCDPLPGGGARADGVSKLARVPSVYSDWRRMLKEVPVDAIFLAGGDEAAGIRGWPSAAEVVQELGTVAGKSAKWLWVDGPPSRTVMGQLQLQRLAEAEGVKLWLARPLRHSAGHRTLRRLLERDAIGNISALQLRWPLPLDEPHAYAAYAALDLMLSLLPLSQSNPTKMMASRGADDTGSSWISTGGGVSITTLWSGADTWNSPWPRIEVAGTQGRSVTCEGSRKVQLFVPREATRTWEPPGAQLHISSANLAGVGEDVKAFLAAVVEDASETYNGASADVLTVSARVIALWEALWKSIESGELVQVESIPNMDQLEKQRGTPQAVAPNLTLNLG